MKWCSMDAGGCVPYRIPDNEPDAQAEQIAEASAQRYLTKHGAWLCDDCAGRTTTKAQAHGVCEDCGEMRWITHTVRTPKPHREAVA